MIFKKPQLDFGVGRVTLTDDGGVFAGSGAGVIGASVQ